MNAESKRYDLKSLKEKMSEYQHVNSKLTSLYDQQRELQNRENELHYFKEKEQNDVDKLEGRSLANFFYQVVGKMDDKLDQERREAYEAAVRYDAVKRELEAVEHDIRELSGKARELRECEALYEQMLKERREEIRSSGSQAGERILEIELEIASLEQQKQEISEAMAAGSTAAFTADAVLDSLKSAENWGAWDMIGGGTISTFIKHQHMDEAQEKVEKLQVQLRRFRTELADVGRIQEDLQVSLDGFMRFADWFFDGLFVDWAVMNQINQSQSQVQGTKNQIHQVLGRLRSLQSAVEDAIAAKQAEIEEIVAAEESSLG